MQYPLLVFDLDGTLVETAPDLVDTLNVILAREGFPPLPYDVARIMVGGGAKTMLTRGIEADGKSVTPQKLDAMFADFISHYSEHIADRSRPFPGLVDALDGLSAKGFRFAVCTNKLEKLSTALLKALSLDRRFAAICGPDTFGVPKPNPEILHQTIAAAGGSPRHAIMIGDSATDIRTARAAGVPVIAVSFGYSDPPVVEFNPDRIIDDFAQLPAAIAAFNFVDRG